MYVSNRTPMMVILVVIGALFASESAAAQTWTTLPTSVVDAEGINDAGDTVGVACTNPVSQLGCTGYLLHAGVLSTISVPNCGGCRLTAPRAVNNAGEVVGLYVIGGGCGPEDVVHGFVEISGSYTTFDLPGTVCQSALLGINNSGMWVGEAQTNQAQAEAFFGTSSNNSVYFVPGSCDPLAPPPCTPFTTGIGINDFGDLVGSYGDSSGRHGFDLQQGSFDVPGSVSTEAWGVNNAGQIVGFYQDASSHYHGFLLDGGKFTTIDFPGAVQTKCFRINNLGQISGTYSDTQRAYGFVLTMPVSYMDPVPHLLNGLQTTTDTNLLATKGRPVDGVAADGTSEMVIKIPTPSAGHQFQLTLLNNGVQSRLPNEDGALGKPGDTSFSQTRVTVNAGSITSNGFAYAFAVYSAPLDFARPNGTGFKNSYCTVTGGGLTSDDQSGCRDIALQIQDVTAGTPAVTTAITIVRPPVILIHGLWDKASSWKNFFPLVNAVNPGTGVFHTEQISYSGTINPTSTNPSYPPGQQIFAPDESSLGYEHNAPRILKKIVDALGYFKGGDNPPRASVAAVQVDVVAHSMGGVIARTLPLTDGFFDNSFGQGLIHKLITLDTPHLGSPLAAMLLNANNCTRNQLASLGMYSFNSVTYANGGTDNGAVLELQPNSTALNTIAQPGPHPLPAALVAGSYTNWTSLDANCTSCFTTNLKLGCPTDPLAQSFTSTGWPQNFGSTNNSNDGIVAVTSQLNGPSSSTLSLPTGSVALPFPGIAHSRGLLGYVFGLGFTGPSTLDSGTGNPPNPIANAVVNLLNTPVNQAAFTQINP